MTLSPNTALLLIDVQQGLDDPRWGVRNNPGAEKSIAGLTGQGMPSSPRPPRSPVNSAFIGTSLEAHLRARQIDTVVLAGLTTDHCVSSTTRMAANLGFAAIVVSDGTATFERIGPDGICGHQKDASPCPDPAHLERRNVRWSPMAPGVTPPTL